MALADWKTMRKVWTEARDKAKVSKGAVSGVNLGDSIDAVHKASAAGLPAVTTALSKLLTAIKKYKDGITKKNPALAKWLADNLEKKANELDHHCKETISLLTGAKAKTANLIDELSDCLPDLREIAVAAARARQKQTAFTAEAKPSLDRLLAASAVYEKWGKFVRAVASTNLVHIEGKPSMTAAAEGLAKKIEDWVVCLKEMANAPDVASFTKAAQHRAPSRQVMEEDLDIWGNSLKASLG